MKDLRKAFFKRAKVEHPDHDKTPGAKARFQNVSHKTVLTSATSTFTDWASVKLQDTFENLCDESKRKEHDQQRLAREKAAAAAADRIMATQPSVADSLRAKWKAEEEALRKAEDMRTREARKTAQGAHQYEKPPKANGPKADPHSPKESRTGNPKETLRKEQQRQRKPEETEEDRLRKQKIADDLLAKKKAADEKKRREDAAAEQTRQKNRLQERVIVIRNLPPGTRLSDVFEPLVDLAPGPVFDARFWSARIVAIEFCTDIAARRVLALARKGRLFIKDSSVTVVQLIRSTNKMPAVGSASRVVNVNMNRVLAMGLTRKDVIYFLMQNGLQGERVVSRVGRRDTSIRLASWADAEKAITLLAQFLPGLEISYGHDPCGAKKGLLLTNVNCLLQSFGLAATERERVKLEQFVFTAFVTFSVCMVLFLAYNYFVERWWKSASVDTEDDSKLPATTGSVLNVDRDHV